MKWTAESLGLLELTSIAAGVRAADEVVKAAHVELLEAIPISPGNFLVIFAGGVAEVEASLEAGRRIAADAIVDELRLATVHPDVPPAIARPRGERDMRASLGVVETATVAGAIVGADAAAKAADVLLLEIAPGRGIGGKGFFTLTGDVASVQAGADAARALLDRRAAHLRTEILAGPHPAIRARVARMLMGPFERLADGEESP
jgi:microcompartment protein CcmL/EutN